MTGPMEPQPTTAATLQSRTREVLDWLGERQDAMAELLAKLVEAESPSDDPESQARVQQILFYALEERRLRVRRIAGRATGGHLLAIPQQRRRHRPFQLVVGHSDTVWPLGTIDRMPVTVGGGRLAGPGAYDMKGGLVQALFALGAIRALGIELDVAPLFFINSDEEIGSHESIPWLCRLARISDRAFVVEPSLGRDGRLKTARKGVGRFTVRVIGRAAHAGLDPERGASAVLELSHVIQQLFALNDPASGVTVNVGRVTGGRRPNVIAPDGSAEIDVRVLRHEDAVRLEDAIQRLHTTTAGTRLVIEGGFSRPPMERTPRNRHLWQRARRAAADLGLEIDEAVAGGGSDGNITSQYTATLDGLGAVGDGAHADDEFVFLEHMPKRAALLARLLMDPPLAADAEG